MNMAPEPSQFDLFAPPANLPRGARSRSERRTNAAGRTSVSGGTTVPVQDALAEAERLAEALREAHARRRFLAQARCGRGPEKGAEPVRSANSSYLFAGSWERRPMDRPEGGWDGALTNDPMQAQSREIGLEICRQLLRSLKAAS